MEQVRCLTLWDLLIIFPERCIDFSPKLYDQRNAIGIKRRNSGSRLSNPTNYKEVL